MDKSLQISLYYQRETSVITVLLPWKSFYLSRVGVRPWVGSLALKIRVHVLVGRVPRSSPKYRGPRDVLGFKFPKPGPEY